MSAFGFATESPILVPLDGSELAERALRYAAAIPGRSIRLLACAPIKLTAAQARWARGETPPDGGTWRVTSPEDYLDLVAYPLRAEGRSVETVVVAGKAGPAIVGASADAGCIVMSTRGQGVTRLLVGSTSDYVARNAIIPTLLIRDEESEAPAILRVVVPLDGSDAAEEALSVAATLKHGFGAALHLVRVVDPSTWLASTARLEQEAQAYLEEQASRLDGGNAGPATYEVCVAMHGTVAERILATTRPGDLVVMATRRRSGLAGRLLGSVSAAVAELAAVPVVLVRAPFGATEASGTGVAETA